MVNAVRRSRLGEGSSRVANRPSDWILQAAALAGGLVREELLPAWRE